MRGWFQVTLPCGETCLVTADNDIFDKGWEHVSVSLDRRCLTWEEMCIIKDLCFYENEVAMQLHPAKENYINITPYCLFYIDKRTEITRQKYPTSEMLLQKKII